ncbi:MAG: CHAT domain-containing protein [Holophagales bacterium]|nr:CHAT domain-containing protein [Holophagales bacterium]
MHRSNRGGGLAILPPAAARLGRVLSFLCVATSPAMPIPASGSPAPGSPPAQGDGAGVVLELESGGEPALESPLRAGDRLDVWQAEPLASPPGPLLPLDGSFCHPFDLLEWQVSLPGYAAVEIRGWRGGEALSATWTADAFPCLGRLEAPQGGAEPALDLAWRSFLEARELERGGRFAEADSAWQQAVENAASRPGVVAALLERWASARESSEDLETAVELYRRAAEAWRAHRPEGLGLASTLHLHGTLHLWVGEALAALPLLEEAVHLRRALAPGTRDLGRSLNNLGLIYGDLGRSREGEAVLRERLELVRSRAPDSLREASVLNNLGTLAYSRGDLAEAEAYLRASKSIRERLDPGGVKLAQSLNNLAAIMEERGELEQAELWYRQALAVRSTFEPKPSTIVSTLGNLAVLVARRDRPEEGMELANRGWSLAVELWPGTETEAWAAKVLAHSTLELPAPTSEDLHRASEAAERAVALSASLFGDSVITADAWATLGQVRLRWDQLEGAEEALTAALEIRRLRAPGSRWLAESHTLLALLADRRGQPERAIELQLRAIALLEAEERPAGESPHQRAMAAAKTVDWYRRLGAWLVEAGEPERAFDLYERSRARGLLAMLAERELSFGRDLPPEVEAERQRLAQAYGAAWQRLSEVPAEDPEAYSEALARLAKLRDARRSLDGRIRTLSPRLARLRSPVTATLETLRTRLSEGTLVLAYSVEAEGLLLFALARKSEAPAQLTVHRRPLGRAELHDRVESFRRLLATPEVTVEQLGVPARRLFEDLLGPVAEQLAAARGLVVIPDGPLHHLPFPALVAGDGRYLVEALPVSRSASVTVALGSGSEVLGPGLATLRERGVVAFGDPEPSEDPLAWSRMEVETIGRLHPAGGEIFLGEEASEAAWKALGSGPSVLHFAGHAEVDDLFPLDSHLRLAAGDGENGRLQAWEIFEELRIDARLVTLSGCETGVGREVDGEGLAGLAQAFFFAGAEAVVSSGWKVDDRSAALLMMRFYHHLFHPRPIDASNGVGGVDPRASSPAGAVPEALRQAQLDLLYDRVDWPEPEPEGWLDRLVSWAGAASRIASGLSLRSGDGSPSSAAGGLDHPNRWAAFQLAIGGY